MATFGTPGSQSATKLLLLGSGELGKEVAIEAQRLGIEVIAVDRYPNAPAMQVAHRSYVISMLDERALREIVDKEKPDFIVPEIEAIATNTLVELEQQGYHITPNAKAVKLTMDRKGIRQLAAEELKLPTSPYVFASNLEEYFDGVQHIGLPCVVKPVMSSSGKGQMVVRNEEDIKKAWDTAQTSGRAGSGDVIIESLVNFDYEITLLTVRHVGGITFCQPIGHRQVKGDYRESWQPHPMSDTAWQQAQKIAETITSALAGYGVFGVELFIKDDTVLFNEVSPRPHDTGLVTLVSQDLSQFALHIRALSGLPIPQIKQLSPAASHAIIANGHGKQIVFHHLEQVLSQPDTHVRLFGKPEISGERRMGVLLSLADTTTAAREKVQHANHQLEISVC